MNRFSYWWTKLRLRAAGCAVRWAKKQVLLDIQNMPAGNHAAVKPISAVYPAFR